MGARLVAILFVSLALAGCIGKEAPSATTGTAGGTSLDPAVVPDLPVNLSSVAVPTWHVGDAWHGAAYGFGEERRFTIVVTKAEGEHYTLESTDERMMTYDAMYDVSYLGRIRMSDLAGAQQDKPVQFFSFPLENGKTWKATWDGLEVALTATQTPRGYDIVGVVGEETYVAYDYVPELRWWSKLQFVQEGYGITIDRVEAGWTGTLASVTAKLLYEGTPMLPIGTPGAGAFSMDEGQSFGVVTLYGGGAHWTRAFYLLQPDGQPYLTTTENVEAEALGPRYVFQSEEIPAVPGEWHILAPSVHDPGSGFYVSVHQVATGTKAFPAGA